MKLDQVNSSVLQTMLKGNSQSNAGKSAKSATSLNDAVSLSNPSMLGYRVVQFSLSQSLTLNGKNYSANMPNATQTQADDENTESLFDFQKVADNVLSFVTNTINARKQSGDDNEALEKMLGQARKGIDKGFSDARKELDKSGVLDAPLNKGIDKSYDLIQKGLTDFEKDLFGQNTEATDANATATTADASKTDTKTDKTVNANNANSVKTPKEIGNNLLAALTGQQSASLELTTKEGDKVTIQFDDQQSWRQQQNSGLAKKALQTYGDLSGSQTKKSDTSHAPSTSSSSSAFYSHTTQFSFKVEGDLSNDELKSISDMVNKVGSLSDSFFGGNISDALQQAQKLDLNDSELTQLSLNLYQKQAMGWQSDSSSNALTDRGSTTTDPTVATTDASNSSGLTDNQQAAAALPDAFSQLGDYLTQMQSMFDQMIASFNPDSQGNLQSWVAKQQHPDQSEQQVNQFVSFNQRMQQALSLLSGSQSAPAEQAIQTTTPVDLSAS